MRNISNITDFTAPELDIYARLSEGQLLHYYEPDVGLFIAESPKVIGRALDAGYEPVSFLVERKHIEGEAKEVLSRCQGVPVYTAELDVLKKLTGFPLTRGVLCAMRRRPLPDVRSLCVNASRIAILENVMNPTNVGAIFRSAAALSHGCDSFDARLQRSVVPQSCQSEYGNCLSIPVDIFYGQKRGLAKSRHGNFKRTGF